MERILHSKLDYEARCLQDSIQLFKEGLKQKRLPGRLEHFKVTALRVLLEPFTVAAKVFNMAFEVLGIAFLPISSEKYKLKSLAFRATCLVLLNPFDVIVGVAAAVTRIASSVFGFISPYVCAHGWMLAERMEYINVKLQASLWEKLTPQRKSEVMYAEIKPRHARFYLDEASFAIHRNFNSHEIQSFKKEIPEKIQDSIVALSKLDEQLFEEVLTPKKHSPKDIKGILEKIWVKDEKTSAGADEELVITVDEIKKLSMVEMEQLVDYIVNQVRKNFQNRKESDKVSEKNPDYKEFKSCIHKAMEEISFCERFGIENFYD